MAGLKERGDRGGRWKVTWRLGGKQMSKTYDDLEDAVVAKTLLDKHNDRLSYDQLFTLMHPGLAQVFEAEVEAQVEEGLKKKPVTVAAFLPEFLDASTAAPVTRRKYAAQIRNEVLPVIGLLAVEDVTYVHIKGILDRLAKCDCTSQGLGRVCGRRRTNRKRGDRAGVHVGGLDKRTVDRYFSAMRAFFYEAVKRGIRSDNPVTTTGHKAQTLAGYHSGPQEEVHFYMTKVQARILTDQFSADDRKLVEFLFHTGTRISEATALRAFGVERGPNVQVRVDTAWTRNLEGKVVPGPPKSKVNRTLRINDALFELLDLGEGDPGRLVFPGPTGERLTYDQFKDRWDAATIAATRCPDHPPSPRGVKVGENNLAGRKCGDNGGINDRGGPCGQWVAVGWNRCAHHIGPDPTASSTCKCWDKRLPRRPQIHDTRHTHVAWCIDAGMKPAQICRRIGDQLVTFMQVYAGLLPDYEEAIVNDINY